jgi:hypothetical protein
MTQAMVFWNMKMNNLTTSGTSRFFMLVSPRVMIASFFPCCYLSINIAEKAWKKNGSPGL